MGETAVEEYERRRRERRARGERRVTLLAGTSLGLLVTWFALFLGQGAVRLTAYVGAYWQAVFVVGAAAGLSAAGAAAAAVRDWPALTWRSRLVGLMPWPAFVVYVIASALLLGRTF